MREFYKQYVTEKQNGYLQSGRYERVDCILTISDVGDSRPCEKKPAEMVLEMCFIIWTKHCALLSSTTLLEFFKHHNYVLKMPV